jgi:hypothetical protein
MKAQLQYTEDLSAFVPHDHQQPMSAAHSKRIAESMGGGGFWPSKPVSCVRKGNKLVVVDGHHRLAAAKIANVGVYYVVEPVCRLEDIGDANVLVRKWSNESFAKMYAGQGNPHYVELLRAVGLGVPLSVAASVLRGEAGHSGNAGRFIKTGEFKVKTRENMRVIIDFINELSAACDVVRTKIFIEALSVLLFVPEFDSAILKKRIQVNPLSVAKCNNRDQMLQQLDEVYNFRSREKVPLAFLAKEKMKERSDFCAKKEGK